MTSLPFPVLGVLTPHDPSAGVRPCIPSNELRADDTLFAAGFRSGSRRRILEVRLATEPRRLYVRVAEGWYQWRHVYANVLEF